MFGKIYYVYILTNKRNNVFYIGITSNLGRRIDEHKNKLVPGFTNKYEVNKLVYYEELDNPYDVICREKQLKRWHREWKINLIKKINPKFEDLTKLIVSF